MSAMPHIISPRSLNARFREEFAQRGWTQEFSISHGKMAVDFEKHGVLVEVQLGKDVYSCENVHHKFPLARRRLGPAAVECCVLVLPSQNMCRQMSNGIGSYESILRNYIEPMQDRITYPLVVFALEPLPQGQQAPLGPLAQQEPPLT